MRVVFVTAPPGDGARIGKALLEERLAACVNILPGVKSMYWWEKKIQEDEEILLIIKTREDLLDDLFSKIKSLHPYDLPEIISLPVEKGFEAYLKWVDQETRS